MLFRVIHEGGNASNLINAMQIIVNRMKVKSKLKPKQGLKMQV